MKIFLTALLSIPLLFCFQRCNTGSDKPHILVFKKAEFYFHESTAAGEETLLQFCRENGFSMDVTEEGESFTDENLKKYIAVVFLNTAGDVFNPEQEKAFERYIHAGGGFMGIHTAIDTEHNWDWYGNLVGARFESQSEVEKATLIIEDHNNPATRFIDSTLELKDEWFNLKNISPDIHVLLSLDENSYKGGTMGNFHPVSWYHEFEGSRVFITSIGHTKEVYKDSSFLKHLSGGFQYVTGNKKIPDYNNLFSKKEAVKNTTETGFVKSSVVCDLYEPMEMDILPDGKIIFIERRGTIKLFDPQSGKTSQAGKLDVYIKQEEGLLGLAIDPNWEENHWIYLYYSPENDNSAIRLSRFEFVDDKLITSSEKIILKVATLVRPDLFHAAGSLEFDEAGFLYLATGDNSSHHDGFSEIDERPGMEIYDAQKSSSNSMDLRGKILRIKPLPDGSYLCPSGNLYVNKDIVVQFQSGKNSDNPDYLEKLKGSLNPVALGKFNSNVSTTTGNSKDGVFSFPQSDSVFSSYGRPEIFVMGVRNPFRISYDDRRQTLYWGDVGPDAPAFDSLYGSEGFDEINAAKTAGFFGWPYFIGPNNAYRYFNYSTNKTGPYFDPLHPVNNSPNNTGTRHLPPAQPALIWYPFSSSKEFPLVANGTRCSMAGPTYYSDKYPFDTRFPDRYNGNLIIYDWMRNWMMAVKLDSIGNYVSMEQLAPNLRLSRPIDMLIDKKGSLWMLEYGMEWYSKNPDACLSRIDFVKGDEQTSLKPGTASIHWNFFNKNRSFYQPGEVLPYRLEYSDPSMGLLVSQKINIQYRETGLNTKQITTGINIAEKRLNEFSKGQILIDKSDCKSCHAVKRKINGPSYLDISSRYRNDKSANDMLIQKILKGGSGNWGDRMMIGHPQITSNDAGEIVKWILSLDPNSKENTTKEGRYKFTLPEESKYKHGYFEFKAVINDQPGETVIFRPVLQQVENADSSSGILRTYKQAGDGVISVLKEFNGKGIFVFRNIDLTGIKSIDFAVETNIQKNQSGNGIIEIRLDGTGGQLLGSVVIPASDIATDGILKNITLSFENAKMPGDGLYHDLFFIIKNESAGAKAVLGMDWLKFNLN